MAIQKDPVRIPNPQDMTFRRVGVFMSNLEPHALIGVRFCDDASALDVTDKSGTRKGAINMTWAEFTRVGGSLRITYSEVEDGGLECTG